MTKSITQVFSPVLITTIIVGFAGLISLVPLVVIYLVTLFIGAN